MVQTGNDLWSINTHHGVYKIDKHSFIHALNRTTDLLSDDPTVENCYTSTMLDWFTFRPLVEESYYYHADYLNYFLFVLQAISFIFQAKGMDPTPQQLEQLSSLRVRVRVRVCV